MDASKSAFLQIRLTAYSSSLHIMVLYKHSLKAKKNKKTQTNKQTKKTGVCNETSKFSHLIEASRFFIFMESLNMDHRITQTRHYRIYWHFLRFLF